MKKFLLGSVLLVSSALYLGGCDMMPANHHTSMWSTVTHAVAVLQPTAGNTAVKGTINFEQVADGVHVTGEVSGLAPNSTHGFHIHEFGDASAADGTAAGGHYNPEGAAHQHADLGTPNAHAGDMGNIKADASGTAKIDLTVKGISIAGMMDPIIGRGVVVHAGTDDLKTQPTGNSGARIAVGVIGVKKNP